MKLQEYPKSTGSSGQVQAGVVWDQGAAELQAPAAPDSNLPQSRSRRKTNPDRLGDRQGGIAS
jgi:hypothetical protein